MHPSTEAKTLHADCSSGLEQATDKLYTFLELGKIGDEDATIKTNYYVHACKHRSQDLACTDCS